MTPTCVSSCCGLRFVARPGMRVEGVAPERTSRFAMEPIAHALASCRKCDLGKVAVRILRRRVSRPIFNSPAGHIGAIDLHLDIAIAMAMTKHAQEARAVALKYRALDKAVAGGPFALFEDFDFEDHRG